MDKKVLVVYYSRTGTTKKVAQAISSKLNCETEEILDVRSRMGLFGWLRSGAEGVKEKLAEIQGMKKDPSLYDIVILGTPVWASKMSSPLRTYITKHKQRFKQVVFFVVSGGVLESNLMIDGLENLCGKKSLAVFKATMAEVKSGQFADRLQEFVSKI